MSARVLEGQGGVVGQGAGVAVQELRRPGRQIRAGETRAGRRTAWIRRRMPGYRRRQSWAWACARDEGAVGQGLSRPPPNTRALGRRRPEGAAAAAARGRRRPNPSPDWTGGMSDGEGLN